MSKNVSLHVGPLTKTNNAYRYTEQKQYHPVKPEIKFGGKRCWVDAIWKEDALGHHSKGMGDHCRSSKDNEYDMKNVCWYHSFPFFSYHPK
jgi:hypothetical protein